MEGEDTTCRSLLRELQTIWEEMGESDEERDRMLLQLEQECLDVYRRKVDQANCARARLHQLLADSESELASLLSLLGDRPCTLEKRSGTTLREQLLSVSPQLECLRLRKEERLKQFEDVQCQIQRLSREISPGTLQEAENGPLCWKDLSLRKLHEYHCQLQELQDEKSSRFHKVSELLEVLQGYCVLLGIDYTEAVKEVHPSLCDPGQSRSISDETLEKLGKAIEDMENEKSERLQKIHNLVALLRELWNLMDTPFEERQPFRNIIRNLAAPEHDLAEPSSLTLKTIAQAEKEVVRLNQLKVSRMKELVLKKQGELEETCNMAHLDCDPNLTQEKVARLLESGIVDLSELLATIESSIAEAKEESLGRQDIMERMERWISACEEESWLEEYNKDESRFNATRGAHLNLKRAERARVIVAKLPNLLESLKSKTRSWEDERGRPFLYNGISLLAILEEYSLLRREKEEEKRRLREEKRMQEQLQTEQELLYGTKPSKKGQVGLRVSGNNANRRLSIVPEPLPAPKASNQGPQKGSRVKRYSPMMNYVALPKDPEASSIGSAPDSPVAA
ncbi:65-kDa microtubule-associated protein 1 [Selaginella moellendorffii]|uniref:65-kDa microtubule-associated protein 1 n=1 Tax=Selaginella moellendorffii TaxID=88036 RepID=UPI000D1CEDB1|nr:65-kDa microtubule-associated protein 1 [Selaginella moellendorffii]XP_024534483.1 65-kDa microtubule-associated protein 1 [Selaginella moellendorffii]|eukprot:XP_024534482.1 65-kDa microtubule-associated protein 1 [Selaginella moellendorffii]